MIKFEVGQRYICTSACDSNCKWTFEILHRTAKTVNIETRTGIEKRKISTWNDVECIFPLGKYSMAPILRADELAEVAR